MKTLSVVIDFNPGSRCAVAGYEGENDGSRGALTANEVKLLIIHTQEYSIMSMADRDGLIWYDGKLVPWREATTHVLTHTLHYGMGVFEGVRAYKGERNTAIFRLQEHTDRLFRSAHILGMKLPYAKEEIFEAQRTVVRENKLE